MTLAAGSSTVVTALAAGVEVNGFPVAATPTRRARHPSHPQGLSQATPLLPITGPYLGEAFRSAAQGRDQSEWRGHPARQRVSGWLARFARSAPECSSCRVIAWPFLGMPWTAAWLRHHASTSNSSLRNGSTANRVTNRPFSPSPTDEGVGGGTRLP